jgi:hypothetical protein
MSFGIQGGVDIWLLSWFWTSWNSHGVPFSPIGRLFLLLDHLCTSFQQPKEAPWPLLLLRLIGPRLILLKQRFHLALRLLQLNRFPKQLWRLFPLASHLLGPSSRSRFNKLLNVKWLSLRKVNHIFLQHQRSLLWSRLLCLGDLYLLYFNLVIAVGAARLHVVRVTWRCTIACSLSKDCHF